MTPVTGRAPNVLLASSRHAAAVWVQVSGSTTTHPVVPSMNVMLEMS